MTEPDAGSSTGPAGPARRSGMAGPVESVTAVVGDLDAAVATYRQALGLLPGRQQAIRAGTGLAAHLPQLAGAPCVVLAPPGHSGPGVLRLAEIPGIAAPAPLTTLGWAAAEYLVADVDKASARAKEAGLPLLADPGPVGSGGGLRAVQVRGPAGEAIYLTQVTAPPPGFDLPLARAEVGPIFIAVLASASLPDSRGLLESRLGARRVTDHPLPVRALNGALGLPAGTRHQVSSVQLAGQTVIEVDQYPAGAPSRIAGTGTGTGSDTSLDYGGIIAVSVHTAGPAATAVLPAAGGALLELLG